jgi:hypothetical protein
VSSPVYVNNVNIPPSTLHYVVNGNQSHQQTRDDPSPISNPVAEKHHPGETQPPETCESPSVQAAMSLLTRQEIMYLKKFHSPLDIGTRPAPLHAKETQTPACCRPEHAPSKQPAGDDKLVHDRHCTTAFRNTGRRQKRNLDFG